MLLLRTMINVKITNRTEKEDYVAVERETGAIALPSKHVFAIFSVGIISVLLALPFGQLIPENYSPFSALSAGRQEQNRRYEQAYLRNDESVAEKNLEISSTAGSEENYDDEVIPEALLANDSKDDSYTTQSVGTDQDIERQKFSTTDDKLKKEVENSEKFIANIMEPKNITDERKVESKKESDAVTALKNTAVKKEFKYDGKWYEQTVKKGDSLFKIFTYLNLDVKDLKKIKAASGDDNLNLAVGDKIQFLVNNKNVLQEIAIPLAGKKQLRFSRDLDDGSFAMSKEDRFAQFENNKKSKMEQATKMPGYVEAQKEKEAKEKELLLAKEKAEKEKAKLDAMAAALDKKEALAEEKEQKVNLANRPRLLIGSIRAGENFDKAAKRLGLTRSEIVSIKNQYSGKINFKRVGPGDNFRVLFNGVGSGSSMTAISVDSARYGQINLYRHPQNHIFYEENGYHPSTGTFRRFPFMGQVKVNSPFNLNRYHPIKKRRRPHYGVDFKLPIGSPVYAPAEGTVTYAGYMRGGGYTVIINHKGGYTTVYMHLSKFDVRKGQQVRIGQVIAKSGNTGYSTGSHLHYEVHINGRAVDPLKVDLPSGSPATAQRLRESFKNTVYILKTELYKNALAENK